jgi:hypothetical protein
MEHGATDTSMMEDEMLQRIERELDEDVCHLSLVAVAQRHSTTSNSSGIDSDNRSRHLSGRQYQQQYQRQHQLQRQQQR